MSNRPMNDPTPTNHDITQAKTPETPIIEQFNKLKEIVLVNNTATTFANSLHLLLILIKESMILAWLALCWGIVALSLTGEQLKWLTQHLKHWWQHLNEVGQQKSATDMAQAFTAKSQHVFQKLVVEARKQVGLQDHP
jgi:hypothetical protein